MQYPMSPVKPLLGMRLEFTTRYLHAAKRAGDTYDAPTAFLLALSGAETCWGRDVVTLPNGDSSNNLFNLFGGPRWRGEEVLVQTTELVLGVPQRRTRPFRVYYEREDSFMDFARWFREEAPQAWALRGDFQRMMRTLSDKEGWTQYKGFDAKRNLYINHRRIVEHLKREA